MEENLNPPEGKKICPDCKGDGKAEEKLSSCCGAPVRGNSDDYGICTECKEHCDYDGECYECSGTGYVDKEEDPGAKADRKYEEKNDK